MKLGLLIENMIKSIVLATRSFRRPSIAYCARHGLLPSVLIRTPSNVLRNLLFLPPSEYESQLNQEVFALMSNRCVSGGFFVEIGANDGFTLSNSVYLEEKFGWSGLLVEANPCYLDSLRKRKAKSVIAAVVREEGYYDFRDAGLYGGIVELLDNTHKDKTKDSKLIKVFGTTLERILREHNAPELINFISIDVEGAEEPIVEQMCRLQNYRFVCGCIEYNARTSDLQKIKNMLKEYGYKVVWEGQTRQDIFFINDSSRQ